MSAAVIANASLLTEYINNNEKNIENLEELQMIEKENQEKMKMMNDIFENN